MIMEIPFYSIFFSRSKMSSAQVMSNPLHNPDQAKKLLNRHKDNSRACSLLK